MKIGVLCIHGYTGGPYEVQPLANYLLAHTEGWLIEVITLSGHGHKLSLKNVKAFDWIGDVEVAYRNLRQRVDIVYVIGFSMGGLLAIHLATKFDVKKVVLLSAALKYIDPKNLVLDFIESARSMSLLGVYDDGTFQRYKMKFGNVPFQSAIQFMKIVKYVTPKVSQVTQPTYIVQGKKDGMVPYKTAQILYSTISSLEKEIYYSQKGKHHICYSLDCATWFEKVKHFLLKK